MRKVMYTTPDEKEEQKGFFHELGTQSMSGDGIGCYTVAIIEDLDGVILLVSPERVRFLEQPMPF